MITYRKKLSNNCLVKKNGLLKSIFLLVAITMLPATKAVASEQYVSLSRNFVNVNFQGPSAELENYLRYVFATSGAGYSAIYGYNFDNATKGLGIEVGYQLNETEKRTRSFVEGGPSPYEFFGDSISYTGTTAIEYSKLYVDLRYYYSVFQRTATPAALYAGIGYSQTESQLFLNGAVLHEETYANIANFVFGVRVKFTENAFLFIDYQSLFPYVIAEEFTLAKGEQFTVEASSNTIGVSILFGSKK